MCDGSRFPFVTKKYLFFRNTQEAVDESPPGIVVMMNHICQINFTFNSVFTVHPKLFIKTFLFIFIGNSSVSPQGRAMCLVQSVSWFLRQERVYLRCKQCFYCRWTKWTEREGRQRSHIGHRRIWRACCKNKKNLSLFRFFFEIFLFVKSFYFWKRKRVKRATKVTTTLIQIQFDTFSPVINHVLPQPFRVQSDNCYPITSHYIPLSLL